MHSRSRVVILVIDAEDVQIGEVFVDDGSIRDGSRYGEPEGCACGEPDVREHFVRIVESYYTGLSAEGEPSKLELVSRGARAILKDH